MAASSSLVRPLEDRTLLGITLVLLAVLTFACVDTVAKYLVLSGLNPIQVAFMRHLVTIIIMLGLFVPGHGQAIFHTNNLKLEFLRGLILAVGSVLNFAALLYLPLTALAAILFTMPLIVTGLSPYMLGERVGWRRWIAIIVGFIGVLVIIQPGGESFQPAALIALGAAFLFAWFNILNRKLAGIDSAPTQQVYAALVSVVVLAPGAAFLWIWPENSVGWALILLLGIIATFGHLLATIAHRYAAASTLAPFYYPHIIFASILSWLVFNQPPKMNMMLGALIVVGAGLYVWQRERQKAEMSKS